MGGKIDDLSGRRFGKLTAVEPTRQRRNGYAVWRCLCDCGKEVFIPSHRLKNGYVASCGCTGDGSKNPKPGGSKKDCGCRISRRNDCRRKDWIGKRFGQLEVIAYSGRQRGKHYWTCLCDCGKETLVCQSNLQNGHTKSCGCMVNPMSTRHFVDGTCLESIRSRRTFSSNKSGVRGVYQNKKTGRWVAQITFQGKTRYLGSYDNLEDAAQARAEGEKIFENFLEKHPLESD